MNTGQLRRTGVKVNNACTGRYRQAELMQKRRQGNLCPLYRISTLDFMYITICWIYIHCQRANVPVPRLHVHCEQASDVPHAAAAQFQIRSRLGSADRACKIHQTLFFRI